MKLRVLSILVTLVFSLAACNSRSNPGSSPEVQSPATIPSSADASPDSVATTSSSSSATASPNSINNNWYNYSSQDGSYSVKFPNKPKENEQKVGQADFLLVTYVDNKKPRSYLTSISDILLNQGTKASDINVEKALDNVREATATNAKAKVTNETKISLNGYSGREITMFGQNKQALIGRVFVNPKTLKYYQAYVIVGDGNLEFPEAKAFLDSFTINK